MQIRGHLCAEPSLQLAPARTLGRSIDSVAGAARMLQKTTALGKPDANLFIARTHRLMPASQRTYGHATPASQSDSTQL